MKRKHGLVPVLAVAAVVVAAAGAAAEGVFLGYNFTEEYQQEYVVKFNQEVDLGSWAFSQFVDMEVTVSCVSFSDTLTMMEMKFDKVEAARMQFDDMVEDPMGERLTGQAVSYHVDRTGVTSDIKVVGYIEGWEQMEKVVTAIVENWYAYLPSEEVEKGGAWSRKIGPREDGGLTVEGTSNYEFVEVAGEKGCQCAKIKAESRNTIAGKQTTPMGAMNVEGAGEGESEMYFCIESSSIVKYKAKIEMKMDMTPEDGGDTTGTVVAITMEREVK